MRRGEEREDVKGVGSYSVMPTVLASNYLFTNAALINQIVLGFALWQPHGDTVGYF